MRLKFNLLYSKLRIERVYHYVSPNCIPLRSILEDLSFISVLMNQRCILSLLISIKSHKKKSYCLCSTQIQSQIQHTWEEPQSVDSQNIARNIYSVQSFARATINPIVNPAQRICWYNKTKRRVARLQKLNKIKLSGRTPCTVRYCK